MKIFWRLFFILVFTLATKFSFAQKYAIGGSVMYNFQTESYGAGVRGVYHPNHVYSYNVQISYIPSFNKVHEYTLGLGLEYKFIRQRKFYFYLLGHGGYNGWIDYKESPMKDAKPNNWNLEGGAGFSTWGCLRPFVECRYNANFKECHVQVGIIYVFGCSRSTNPNTNTSFFGLGRHRGGSCPGYGNY
jgi:hypothetical protein